jgi:hypothetical protein
MTISPEFSSDVFALTSWLSLYKIEDGLVEVNVEDTRTANERIISEIEKHKDSV